MIYGYARVSTTDQNTAIQKIALQQHGCQKIIEEKASGAKHRPMLEHLIKQLKVGDTLIVHKLDRLARSMTHFIRTFERLREIGCAFKSITENIETTTPQGRMYIHLLAAFAELERELIKERCGAGQRAARAAGKTWGTPPTFTDLECGKLSLMWRSGWFKQYQLAKMFEVSSPCICHAICRYEKRGRYATKKLHQ